MREDDESDDEYASGPTKFAPQYTFYKRLSKGKNITGMAMKTVYFFFITELQSGHTVKRLPYNSGVCRFSFSCVV